MQEKRFATCTKCDNKVATKVAKGQIISCSGCKGKFVELPTEIKWYKEL